MRKDHFVTHIRREFDKFYCYSPHDATYRHLPEGIDSRRSLRQATYP
jgi:hypothetical protein